MRAISCDRYGCKFQDGNGYTYRALRLDWMCKDCEGSLTHLSVRDPETEVITDHIECGRCGGQEFVRISTIHREQVDAVQVMAGLPIELQKAAAKARRRKNEAAIKDAASLLY